MTGISDFTKIRAEVDSKKEKEFDVSRAMELMWMGLTAQQWLMITALPPLS